MEKPRARLLVCSGALQRPQRVWQAAGNHADSDTSQLHGGHQLWVLVWRPALQREEADSLRGLYADERTVFQLTACLTHGTVQHLTDWPTDRPTDKLTNWPDASGSDYVVKAFRDHSGPAGHCTFWEHIRHFCMCGWAWKQAFCEKNSYLQWHSLFMCWWWNYFFFFRLFLRIMASHFIQTFNFFWQALWNIHVFLPAQKICCQFLWVWGKSYLNMCLSIFQHLH